MKIAENESRTTDCMGNILAYVCSCPDRTEPIYYEHKRD